MKKTKNRKCVWKMIAVAGVLSLVVAMSTGCVEDFETTNETTSSSGSNSGNTGGNGSNDGNTGNNGSNDGGNKVVTAADKKAYVEQAYAVYLEDDFQYALPYRDMIGLPLEDLKAAVNKSSIWKEETSLQTYFFDITGMKVELLDGSVYRFSDRWLNKNSADDVDYLTGAIYNFFSSNMETQVTYVYVVTDGTTQQRITEVWTVRTDVNVTYEELEKKLLSTYHYTEGVDKGKGSGFSLCFYGHISDVDYEGLYDYDMGLSSQMPYPVGIGRLECFVGEKNGTLIQRIYGI